MNDDDDIVLDELFAAARAQQAPPGAEVRGWARFEAAIGGGGATLPGEAPATRLTWLTPAAKLGGVVAAVLAIGIVLSESSERPPAKRAAATARASDSSGAPAVASASARPTTPDAAPIPEPPDTEAPSPSASSTRSNGVPRATAPRPTPSRTITPPDPATTEPAVPPQRAPEVVELQRPTAPASPSTADSLRIEAELLGRAWVAIREGHTDDTRALLAEHARRFPRGALVPEREACQLVARCSAGEPDAIERARRYLDRHQASHLAARVADGCGLPLPSR